MNQASSVKLNNESGEDDGFNLLSGLDSELEDKVQK